MIPIKTFFNSYLLATSSNLCSTDLTEFCNRGFCNFSARFRVSAIVLERDLGLFLIKNVICGYIERDSGNREVRSICERSDRSHVHFRLRHQESTENHGQPILCGVSSRGSSSSITRGTPRDGSRNRSQEKFTLMGTYDVSKCFSYVRYYCSFFCKSRVF